MSTYDLVPYESRAHYHNHPDRMAVVATMLGLDPPPVETCRVLELGCAEGGNLLPMAVALPRAHFVGIDLSSGQIERGQKAVAEIGLTNVAFHAMSVMDVREDFGTFDYVIAHGLYSWVPPEVQEAVLGICSRNLARNGVAMVSYNTYPGWRFRGMVREVILHQTSHLESAEEKVARARAFVAFLAENASEAGLKRQLEVEAELLSESRDAYLFHEHLEDWNSPLYFHDFVSRLPRHGLEYLGETRLASMTLVDRHPEVDELLSRFAEGFLEKEQLFDLLRNRQFRQSLLVKGEAPRRIVAERMDGLLLGVAALPIGPHVDSTDSEPWTWAIETADGKGSIKTNNPLVKTALVTLAEAAPFALPFEEVVSAVARRLPFAEPVDAAARRETLRESMLSLHLGGLVDLHVASPAMASKPGPRPMASPVARWELRGRDRVTTQWHRRLSLSDFDRMVLGLLDGTRSREALLAALVDKVVAEGLLSGPDGLTVTDPAVAAEVLSELLAQSLSNLARGGLLLA